MKPYLEISWSKSMDDPHGWIALYELVLPVESGDIRNDGSGFYRVKMGETKTRCAHVPWYPFRRDTDGVVKLITPFRDGVHLRKDARKMGLEAFVRFQDKRMSAEEAL